MSIKGTITNLTDAMLLMEQLESSDYLESALVPEKGLAQFLIDNIKTE